MLAEEFVELAPLIRRAAGLEPAGLVRIRIRADSASVFVRLPFGVLAGRRVGGAFAAEVDDVFKTAELLAWLDAERPASAPAAYGVHWRTGLPPETGWRRVETVPDEVIRTLVRAGAETLQASAVREGVPGAQPRAEVTDVLLDSIVLTAESGPDRVEVSLRLLSALTRMGFLARGSHAGIDLAGRWLRVSASYGSVYAERPGLGLAISSNR